MRRFIIIALASLAHLAHAETVKTASQPWVDMRIADATNAVSQSVRESSSNLVEMVELRATKQRLGAPQLTTNDVWVCWDGTILQYYPAASSETEFFLQYYWVGTNTAASVWAFPDATDITLSYRLDKQLGVGEWFCEVMYISGEHAGQYAAYPVIVDGQPDGVIPYVLAATPSGADATAIDFGEEIPEDGISVHLPIVRRSSAEVVYSDTLAAAIADAAPADYANVSNAAMSAVQVEIDPNVPSWAKAATKPSYTPNEIFSSAANWIGVQGNAGRIIKVLAQTIGGVIMGGYQVTGSTLNDNNTTTYAYGGVAVRRDGANQDYLWDATSTNGIVRRGELTSAVAPLASADAVVSLASTTAAQMAELGSATTNAIISAIEYIESPETARTTAYTGVSRDTELRDGKLILYHNKTQASNNWTLNLTLADGSQTGPKPVYIWGTSGASTRYSANSVILLVYRAGAWYASDYDANSNNYDRNLVTYCRAAAALAANVLCVGTTNGYVKVSTNVTFDVHLPILFNTTAQTAGKTNGNYWYSNMTAINLGTTWSGWAGTSATRRRPVFLVGSYNADDETFTIDAECPFSLDPVRPCIPLGWYNANADSSFCFLPGSLLLPADEELDPIWSAEKSQYATTNDLSVSQRVVLALMQGTNVLAVVTNYNSQVNLPELSLKYLDGDNGYIEVWREGRRIEAATNALHQIEQDALAAGLAAKADKAWGKYTSGLGLEAPSNTTWISTATTVIAGGYEYAKTVTSNGAVWFLASNGMDLGFAQGSTNAFLSISAADGTPIFSIEKTDSYLVGVDPSAISVVGSTCLVSLPIVATTHPYARVATNLVNAVWSKEDEHGMPAGSPATVSWSGTSGAYVATVDFGTLPQGYCYFEFLQEGMTKIVNAGAMELSGGISFNGNIYHPEVSGDQLIFRR